MAITPTTRMLASAIFRKGYQWPFHAERMLEYGSSLLDVAVYEETQKGRDVRGPQLVARPNSS